MFNFVIRFGANYNPDFYQSDVDPYYNAYEPTQDLQWGASVTIQYYILLIDNIIFQETTNCFI